MANAKQTIELEELLRDKENFLAQLQLVSGAIQYIDNKISQLTKPEKPKEEGV